MKKKLKILATIILLISALTIGTVYASSVNNSKISISNESVSAGSVVSVDVVIENNPGILGATLSLSYDDELTLVDASEGEALDVLTLTKPGKFTSPCQFTWDGLDLSDGDVKDGKILTLYFKVPENAQTGSKYNINLSYNDGDIVNSDLEPLNITIIGGTITVNNNTEPVTVNVGNINATAGSRIEVPVSIANNPGILGATIKLQYDEGLILVDAISGEAFSALSFTAPGKYESGCKFTWDGIELNQNDIKDGTILTLVFDIDANLETGTECNISLSSNDGEIVDNSLNTVNASYVNGKVIIENAPSSEHTYELLEAIEPDCENDGLYIYQCLDCGEVYIEEPAALGHNTVTQEAVEPTCTEDGLTEGSYCSRCNVVFVEQTVIPATGHNNELYRTTVTCEKSGYLIYKCTKCAKLETVKQNAYGHDYRFDHFENEELLVYICEDCNNVKQMTPDEVLSIWSNEHINTIPTRGNDNQFLDVALDDFINAKDYAKIYHFSKYGW